MSILLKQTSQFLHITYTYIYVRNVKCTFPLTTLEGVSITLLHITFKFCPLK